MRDAQRDVDPFLDHVDDAVDQRQPQIDLGIGLEERQRHRQHIQPAEHDRRGDMEPALRRRIFAGRHALGSLDLAQQPPAGFEIGAPWLGQHELARGAHDQADAQMLLQLRQLAADRRQRNFQRARRGADRLPASATATNSRIASRRSMGLFQKMRDRGASHRFAIPGIAQRPLRFAHPHPGQPRQRRDPGSDEIGLGAKRNSGPRIKSGVTVEWMVKRSRHCPRTRTSPAAPSAPPSVSCFGLACSGVV